MAAGRRHARHWQRAGGHGRRSWPAPRADGQRAGRSTKRSPGHRPTDWAHPPCRRRPRNTRRRAGGRPLCPRGQWQCRNRRKRWPGRYAVRWRREPMTHPGAPAKAIPTETAATERAGTRQARQVRLGAEGAAPVAGVWQWEAKPNPDPTTHRAAPRPAPERHRQPRFKEPAAPRRATPTEPDQGLGPAAADSADSAEMRSGTRPTKCPTARKSGRERWRPGNSSRPCAAGDQCQIVPTRRWRRRHRTQ